jgi:hypothetical protein
VRDAEAEPAARDEDARRLGDRARHVLDVHQRVVGDDEVELAVAERERRCVREDVGTAGIGFPGGGEERRRRVEAHDGVPARREVAADAALAAADLQRAPAGRRHEREEGVAVRPVLVVAGPARPVDPVLGLRFPAHCFTARSP